MEIALFPTNSEQKSTLNVLNLSAPPSLKLVQNNATLAIMCISFLEDI